MVSAAPSAPTTSAEPLVPAARSRGPWRALVGLALISLAGTVALTLALQALFAAAPLACGADCAGVLSQHRFALVLGVPVLAWAAALHAALLLVTWLDAWRPGRLGAAQLALLIALLGGSATYLVLGLATRVSCNVCLAMHASAVVAGLGVVLRSRLEAPPGERLRHAGMAALVLALWVLAAWGLGTLAARHQRALAAPAASTDKWLAAICQPRACPSAARYADQVMPADAASIVLSRGPGATLVAWLDLDCAACRSDFAAEEPFFRRLQRERRNARLLMRAPACMRGDAAACQAPAAAVCAGRHAGGEAALDYLAWELSAEPGFYTLEDRRRALSAMSPLAVRCLDNELALGARGSLAAHEDAARTLADAAREHSGCSGPSPAWWCFAATPSFAIIDDAPPRLGRTPADAFASASGALRVEVLEQCLEAEP